MSEIISIRVEEAAKVALAQKAAENGLQLAPYVASVLAEHAAGPPHERPPEQPGPCERSVLEMFEDAAPGSEAAVRKELAVALARRVDRGESNAPQAAGQLAALVKKSGDAQVDALQQMLNEYLSTPVHTHCEGCQNPLSESDPLGGDK